MMSREFSFQTDDFLNKTYLAVTRMSLEETIETYSYFLSKADKMGLAYIQLELYFHRDKSFEGRSQAVPHDVLETYRPFIKARTLLFINA
jgi:hypothetical protein